MFGRSESYFRFPASHGVAPRVTPEDAPARIVEDGLIRLGMFRTPVRQMNLPESRLLRGLGASWPMPPLMLEWIGAGIAHPDWYLGLIVVDAKVGSLAVLYGFNRNTREYFSHDRPGLRRQVKVANSTWNERLEEVQPLVLLSPIEGGGFLYNHKVQMPTQGSLRIGNERVDFDPRRDLSNLDDLKIHVGGTRLHYRWFNSTRQDGSSASTSPRARRKAITSGRRTPSGPAARFTRCLKPALKLIPGIP